MNVNLFHKKWFVHLIVWLSYYFIAVWFFTDLLGFSAASKRALLLVFFHSGIFYLNLFVLLPYVLEKKWKVFYYLIVINLVVLVVFTFKIIDDFYFINAVGDQFFLKGIEDLPPGLKQQVLDWKQTHEVSPERRFMGMRFFANGGSVIIILLISSLYRNQILKRNRDKEAILLKNQMLEAESQILKWQINPHFLFNTLNNIYALAQMKSPRAPDAIHRLSEMLRYVIYDCNEEFVSLKHEISYIKSYIALQLLKDDEISNVSYEFPEEESNLKIAPMLLISFIENSFKHSKIEDLKNGWIDLKIKLEEKNFIFDLRNSIPDVLPAKDRQGGIGLDNVKRRLELIYPKKYQLDINKGEKEFSVYLKLELHED